MKFANYTLFWKDTCRHGLAYAIEHTAALGFDAVEFLVCYDRAPLFESVEQARAAKRLLDQNKLAVSCYSMLTDLTHPDPSVVLDPVLFNIECAAALGAPYFHHTLIPSYSTKTPRRSYTEALEAIIGRAEQIAAHCAKYAITCLYEPQGLYMNGVEGLAPFLARMKKSHPNVGICGDTGNSLFVDVPAEEIFRAFASDIRHVHVKDYIVTDPDGSEWKQRSVSGKHIRDVLPGQGPTDHARLFSYLGDYRGDFSMEFSGSDEEMRASLAYVKELVRPRG